MMMKTPSFADFFEALWGYEPFPWQRMLADEVVSGRWPTALDLPTAAGKTACIDIAIFALASQAQLAVSNRTAPRRIWFVVDRRIVVDEAYERAGKIAKKLSSAKGGVLTDIANCLRATSGTKTPLAVARLRGGILRDENWARLPSQPAVITSTVDQLGSRILFRGYGRSHLAAPIFAGLAAHDSLILLDEAQCSVPFLQTLRSVEIYRGENWSKARLKTPFAFTILSATPPSGIPQEAVFPGAQRDEALDHPELQARLNASKPAELVLARVGRGKTEDPLVTMAAQLACRFVTAENKHRVAVIVNRVRTAGEIARVLQEKAIDSADVVLLTGRIRPFERDELVEKWTPHLKALAEPLSSEKPIFFVSTQCIEVGADFSFDAMVTECASLDALRQRFGRLNRMGKAGDAPAAIVIREADLKSDKDDPVYGTALANTWRLLNERASKIGDDRSERKVIDFGFEKLNATLSDIDDLSDYLSPRPEAPVLLPAHLDLLCQTAPAPSPEPDVQLYLHGKDRVSPEVRVLWRADLVENKISGWEEIWKETVVLCPPTGGEMLSVPLFRFRNWLGTLEGSDNDPDIEGAPEPSDIESPERVRPFLIWRGRDRSQVNFNAKAIRPNDVIVVPSSYGIEGLGQSTEQRCEKEKLDLWERTRNAAGQPPAVRINRAVLRPWLSCAPLEELVEFTEEPAWALETLQEKIDAVLSYKAQSERDGVELPQWLIKVLSVARKCSFIDHPQSGVIALAPVTRPRQSIEEDLFADEDDLKCSLTPAGQPVSLVQHSETVRHVVRRLSYYCLSEEFVDLLATAAYWHDVGKLDERFQLLLRQGNEIAVANSEPLAKSADFATSRSRRRAIRQASGLPKDFRHEILSLQLAERHAPLSSKDVSADLVLHLVASHHGHGRPFAPLCTDPAPPDVSGQLGTVTLQISQEDRCKLIPAYRVDSGLSERFWRLNRFYGWWGLAYLEAILRLGDWYGSERVVREEHEKL